MKVRCVQAERNAAAELNWLLLDQVITDFTTNFDSKRQPWFDLKVMVSVKATDEFTIARVRRRVQMTLGV